jgi:hypothetical protein
MPPLQIAKSTNDQAGSLLQSIRDVNGISCDSQIKGAVMGGELETFADINLTSRAFVDILKYQRASFTNPTVPSKLLSQKKTACLIA